MGKRLAKQHRGGLANWAGAEFERFFGVYRVLLALSRLRRREVLRLALQLRSAHVDDWVEDSPLSRVHFQLKRSRTLSWAAVDSDFRKQLAKRVQGKTVSVVLVVSTEQLARRLRASTKAVDGALVEHFPGRLALAEHLASPAMNAALRDVCVLPAPTSSDLELIWRDVGHGWTKARKPGQFVAVSAVLKHLDDQTPSPLRRPWRATTSWLKAQERLAAVPGFWFSVEDGHLLYGDRSGTSGWVSCKTAAFRQFTSGVIQGRVMSPKTVRKLLERL